MFSLSSKNDFFYYVEINGCINEKEKRAFTYRKKEREKKIGISIGQNFSQFDQSYFII